MEINMEINETECSQLLANIEERIDQYEKDKSHFERLINARKLELAQLENLLQITTNSLGVQKSLLKAIECKKCSTIRTDRETQTETAAVSSINVADILRKIGNIVPAVEEKPKITKQENAVNKSLLSSPGGWKSPSKIKPTDSTRATPQLRVQSQFNQLGAGKPATISRINNALKLCAKRNEPKKVVKDFPNRIKDPSMMDFNSKLVELHRNEEQHLDYNSVTEWTVLRCGSNRRLERLMEKRNREKLEKIERQPECAKLVARADLVANIGLLMNYDLIRHVDRKSKPRRVKKPRSEQKNEPKTQTIANDEKKDSVLMDDFMFDIIDTQISTEAANSRPNNEDDDLYGDLNGPTVNLDLNLLEDGEVDEEKEEDRLEKKPTTKVVTGIKQIDENVPKSREADRNVVKKLRTDDGGSKALQPQSQFVSKENQNESSSKNKNQMNNHHRNHHQHQQSDAYRNRHDNSRHRDRSRSRSKPRSRPGRMRSRSRSGSRRCGDSPPRKQQQQQQTSSSKYHSSRDRIDHHYNNNNKRKRLD